MNVTSCGKEQNSLHWLKSTYFGKMAEYRNGVNSLWRPLFERCNLVKKYMMNDLRDVM